MRPLLTIFTIGGLVDVQKKKSMPTLFSPQVRCVPDNSSTYKGSFVRLMTGLMTVGKQTLTKNIFLRKLGLTTGSSRMLWQQWFVKPHKHKTIIWHSVSPQKCLVTPDFLLESYKACLISLFLATARFEKPDIPRTISLAQNVCTVRNKRTLNWSQLHERFCEF